MIETNATQPAAPILVAALIPSLMSSRVSVAESGGRARVGDILLLIT